MIPPLFTWQPVNKAFAEGMKMTFQGTERKGAFDIYLKTIPFFLIFEDCM